MDMFSWWKRVDYIVEMYVLICTYLYDVFEPPNEETNNLHMQNQRRRSAVQ